jgi:hypothetical protein
MATIDLLTVITLIYGLLFTAVGFIIYRRSQSKPKVFPRLIGIGAGLYLFVSLMTESMLERPITQIVDSLGSNIFLSLGFGIVGYISGRKLARRRK